MKKVRILSIISCVLCLIMLSTSSVFAQGSTNVEAIERFEVKTDLQDVLNLAVEQTQSQMSQPSVSSYSLNRSNGSADVNSGKIKVHPYWGGAGAGATYMTNQGNYDVAITCMPSLPI